MNQFYVYAHYRESDGQIFYVGKGKGGRDKHIYGKSKWWNAIANKHGWFVKRLKENLSEQCAYSLERALISIHQSLLCNISKGGLGGLAFIQKSEEHVRKVAIAQTGRPKSEKTRLLISQKARERLKDPARHWRTTLVVSTWLHKDGRSMQANHLEMANLFGSSLEYFKKVQSGILKSYKGWSVACN